MALLEATLLKTNTMVTKWFVVEILGGRMSGEMNTSLGNGFYNLIMFHFLTNEMSHDAIATGFVEGDDGLFQVHPPEAAPTTELFREWGNNIKLESQPAHLASFCGNIFDPEDKVVMTDPLKVLANTGWGGRNYIHRKPEVQLALLRCKAWSVLYQYAGSPILQSFANYILRLTDENEELERKVTDEQGFWEREKWNKITKTEQLQRTIGNNSRCLVETMWNISIEQQLIIEQYFDKCKKLQDFNFELDYPAHWVDYHNKYVMKLEDDYNLAGTATPVADSERLIDIMETFCPSTAMLREIL